MKFTSALGLLPFAAASHSRRPSTEVRRTARATPGALLETLERRDLFAAPVLDSSAHSTVFGQGITLTAILSPGQSGTVTFLDGTTPLGTGSVDAGGKARLFTASLPVGPHSITAQFQGETSAPLLQTINPALTTTGLISSAGMVQHPIVRPDHVVIVIEEDRFAQAVGDTANMPYLNQLAATGLVYSNSHGVNARGQMFGELNYLALYSGSTQGITDDGPLYSFPGPNLAQSLANVGLSFTGYAESLPRAGDVTTVFAPDPAHPAAVDAYARYYNPMAMFTNVGAGKTNADVNKPFSDFPIDYSTLPTVSFVIPNRLHNTHGSNETPPFANDPATYDPLRRAADTWLQENLNGYLEWAKTHNSLLIVTTESGARERNFAAGGTTVVNGDPRLFDPGVNTSPITHYNVLRTVEAMYGLPPIGASAAAQVLDTNATGELSPGGPVAVSLLAGEAATYTATVSPLAPASGVPTGLVQFIVDGAAYGSPVALSNGSATISLAGLAPGNHLVSATYAGNGSYLGGGSRIVSQPVNVNPTTTTLATSAASVNAGQTVTFTATVAPATGTAVPTGTVTFASGTTVLGTSTVDPAGRATLTTNALAVGNHSVVASYSGDGRNAPSVSAPVSQVVHPAAVSVALSSSAASANAGRAVTFTASVRGAGSPGTVPTGTVTFRDGTAVLGTVPVDASGNATFTTSSLAAGTHFIAASYGGDANFAPATSPVMTQNITPNATTTTLASSAPSATAGQNVVFTATVTGPAAAGALKPGGTVTFRDGDTTLGTATVDAAGKASFATSALAVGTHTITAMYSGDPNFSGSLSAALSQQIVAVPTPTGPANDRFAGRIVLTGAAPTATGTNVGATKEAGEPRHGGNVGGKSVWWSWTPTKSGVVTIETLGSTFKTLLGVYTGSSVGSLTRVRGVTVPVRGAATFTFLARAGQTYQIAVDGVNGAAGNIKLGVRPWPSRTSAASATSSLTSGEGDRDDARVADKKKSKKEKRSK